MKIFYSFIALFLVLSSPASAEEFGAVLDRAEWSRLDQAAREKKSTPLKFALNGKSFETILQPTEIRSPRFRSEITSAGALFSRRGFQPANETIHFRSATGANAALTLSRSGHKKVLRGFVISPEERAIYGLESLPLEAGKDAVLKVSKVPFDEQPGATCGVWFESNHPSNSLLPGLSEKSADDPLIPMESNTLLTTELAIDVDYAFIAFHEGGVQEALEKIEAILNGLNIIYEAQAGITFTLSYTHFWESADVPNYPYTQSTPVGLLNQFKNYWNANFTDVHRDLAHLFSGNPLDGTAVGIANMSSVCSMTNGYALSTHFLDGPTPIGLLVIVAHEIGHNFSALHDVACEPPFIMCPNVYFTAQFSEESINAILPFSEGASCLNAIPDPCPADFDRDGVVGATDLSLVLANWSITPGSPGCGGQTHCAADIDTNNTVGPSDLGAVLASWGACPP